jgi:two-component system, LytTR family, response regulator
MGTLYKCLIVDDEKPAHLVIKSHISNCEELVFSESAFNGKEAIQLLTTNEYDFVFLDIDMPLINGIEVMQTLTKRPATIITTAYNHFAFEAYQHDAVDYLLKPISFSRFLKAVDKAKYFWKSNQEKVKQIVSVSFKVDGYYKEFQVADILYCQSIGNYVKIFFIEKNKIIMVYDSLKNVLDKMPPNLFIQTHKSYIVNSLTIKMIDKEYILLEDNTSIPLGRKYALMVNQHVKK